MPSQEQFDSFAEKFSEIREAQENELTDVQQACATLRGDNVTPEDLAAQAEELRNKVEKISSPAEKKEAGAKFLTSILSKEDDDKTADSELAHTLGELSTRLELFQRKIDTKKAVIKKEIWLNKDYKNDSIRNAAYKEEVAKSLRDELKELAELRGDFVATEALVSLRSARR